MASKPTEPKPYKSRGRLYWTSQWVDDRGRRRTKTFGCTDEVSEGEAYRAYMMWLAEWHEDVQLQTPGQKPTVEVLADRYLEHCRAYYRHKDGTPTGEADNIEWSLGIFKGMFGDVLVANLKAAHLKAYQQTLIERGSARTTINQHVNRLRRWARWAVAEDIAPPDLVHRWEAVPSLRPGRTEAVDPEPVDAAPQAHIDAVLKVAPPTIQAMVRLQLATGMRPGEVCLMRPVHIQTKQTPWLYQPPRHKNDWRPNGKRRVYLGPEARKVLEPFLGRDLMAPLFSPSEAQEQRHEARRENYTPPPDAAGDYRNWPSYRKRRRQGGGNSRYAEQYTTRSYRQAIEYACKAAGVPTWTPNQLRHNAEQRLERVLIAEGMRPELARESARVVLGHSRIETTGIYSAKDATAAADLMEKVG